MRITNWLRVFALGLIAGSLSASVSPLAARPPHPEPKTPLIQKEWTGYGRTAKQAEEDALRLGCEWLASEGGLAWTPDPEYLRLHKMVRFSAPEDKNFDEPMGAMKAIKMQLEVNTEQARDIQKQAQHQRMKERQKQSLLILIGVMCLVGVVGGYLRLEEATKGYCTRLLRIAAILVLIVIVAGLCVAG
ncbi:MAG: hypothetical protein ACYC3I_03245 [Gemmataceae bacterium]